MNGQCGDLDRFFRSVSDLLVIKALKQLCTAAAAQQGSLNLRKREFLPLWLLWPNTHRWWCCLLQLQKLKLETKPSDYYCSLSLDCSTSQGTKKTICWWFHLCAEADFCEPAVNIHSNFLSIKQIEITLSANWNTVKSDINIAVDNQTEMNCRTARTSSFLRIFRS